MGALPFPADDLRPDDLPQLARSVYEGARDDLSHRQALRLMMRVLEGIDAAKVHVPPVEKIADRATKAHARTLLARGASIDEAQTATGLRRPVLRRIADDLDRLTAPNDDDRA